MKSLQESLLDDENVLMDKTGSLTLIEHFLQKTYDLNPDYISYNIYKKNNKFFVDITGRFLTMNDDATTFKNNLFEWGKIKLDMFNASRCQKLTSLEGAPKKVDGSFLCNSCYNLKSLKGAPEECKVFDCSGCYNLKSLEGAPKKCLDFICFGCNTIKSLEGAPKKVDGYFNCSQCENLISLKGAPKEVGERFYCYACGKKFSKEEVKQYSNVKNTIEC